MIPTLQSLLRVFFALPLLFAVFAPAALQGRLDPSLENALERTYPMRFNMGMNPAGVSFWGSAVPFTNALKSARPWRIVSSGSNAALDDYGYPLLEEGQTAETIVLNPNYPEGTYRLTWEGSGEVEVLPRGLEIIALDSKAITLRGKPDGYTKILVASIDPEDPLRSMALYLPGHDADSPTFNPKFVQALRPYGVLRYMDFMQTNGSRVRSWSDRPEREDFTYFKTAGIPLEDLIELANTLQAYPWFCMPHMADDDYIRRSAEMVHDRLDSNLICFVEYSNEVGNHSFEVCGYATERGRELGLATEADVEAFNAKYEYVEGGEMLDFVDVRGPADLNALQRHRFQGLRTQRIAEIWNEVFGDDANRARVVITGSTQQLQISMDNPEVADAVDYTAACSYWGFGLGRRIAASGKSVPELTKDDIFRMLRDDIEEKIGPKAQQQAALARQFGKELILYEGGQHLSAYGGGYGRLSEEDREHFEALCLACQRDPRMGELMQLDFDKWFDAGAKLYTVFSHITPASGKYAWGMQEYLGQPLDEAVKLAALLEYMKTPRW